MSDTVIRDLPDEERLEFENIVRARFLEGECYAFAIAAHELTALPLCGIRASGELRHAFVRVNKTLCFDARGFVAYRDLGGPFGVREPYDIVTCTRADLEAVRPVMQYEIDRAKHYIDFGWGDELGIEECERELLQRFFDELQELLMKYGFAIRGQLPTTLPLIERATGDEVGFSVTPNPLLSYRFDRRLSSDTE